MKSVSRVFSSAVSAIILTTILVFGLQTLSRGQSSKDKDVRVVNTAAEAVPTAIQGVPTVNVATLPAVTISGTPTVGISPAANGVTIGNSADAPALVRDVDHQPREPFKFKFENFLTDGQNFAPAESYTVPDGKRLVIEYVSLEGYLPQNQRMLFGMTVSVNNQGTIHFISLNHQGTFLDGATQVEEFVASQLVGIHVDGGFVVQPFTRRSATAGGGHYEGTIFGYLQDVP